MTHEFLLNGGLRTHRVEPGTIGMSHRLTVSALGDELKIANRGGSKVVGISVPRSSRGTVPNAQSSCRFRTIAR